MAFAHGPGPRVAIVGMYLDPLGRSPDVLVSSVWRDFGRAAAAAQRAGARVCIIAAAWSDADREIEGVPCQFVRERSDPFIYLPGGRKIRRRPRRLLERVRSLTPDLIHFEGLILPRLVRNLAATMPGIPIVAQDHGTKCPRGWRARWSRWGFAPLSAVTFTARSQATPFVAARVLDPRLSVFEVVEGSTPFTPGDQAIARSATGLEGDPCLLWVGNLDPNKDPLLVLEALSRVTSEFPAIRLHMCYRHAPLLQAVQARITDDPALAERVRLLGEVPYADTERYFRAADFLVQASHVEGSGYGIIEALACGTTPIVTDIPSFRRITGEGRYGALTPVDDPAAFADAIRAWSRRDRQVLRRQARTHFERELSFDAIGRQLRAVYDHVLAHR
jgi:glycosyltransferase involved in cell wall biosynthesis